MLVHDKTTAQIQAYIKNPSNALFISTNNDIESGKEISNFIYNAISTKNSAPLITISNSDDIKIGINEIRELRKSLYLGANSGTGIQRAVLIQEPELLLRDSQNTLLKLIEELPARTLIFFTSKNEERVQDTLLSRCFKITLLPINKKTAMKFADDNNIPKDLALKAHLLSDGNSSLYTKQLTNGSNQLPKNISTAKDFLKKNVFDRQNITKNILSKNGDDLLFLDGLVLITKIGMRSTESLQSRNRWKRNLKTVLTARKMRARRVSSKLVLLFLSIEIL